MGDLGDAIDHSAESDATPSVHAVERGGPFQHFSQILITLEEQKRQQKTKVVLGDSPYGQHPQSFSMEANIIPGTRRHWSPSVCPETHTICVSYLNLSVPHLKNGNRDPGHSVAVRMK